jgi:hypothetical protein
MSKVPAIALDSTFASRVWTKGVRGAIDSLVQASLVELFAAYGVAVAPLPRTLAERAPRLPNISAAASLLVRGSSTRPGRLTLSLPDAVLELMRGVDTSSLKEDWARELCNQLMGRLKNRLLHFSVRIDGGALTTIDSQTLARQLQSTPTARVYAVRTLRGEIVVTLQGMPEERELVYVGAGPSANEGDAIWF